MSFLLLACINEEVEYEYYANGSIMNRSHFMNGVVDTFEYYYPTGFTRRILYDENRKIKKDLISDPFDLFDSGFTPFTHIYCATILPDKDSIILGERFTAKIYLITPYPDSITYITAEVGDSMGMPSSNNTIDTLQVIRENHFLLYAKYSTIPQKVGLLKFFGMIKCAERGYLNRYPFLGTYTVKEK